MDDPEEIKMRIALLDSSGAVVVKYTYDAWGNCRVLTRGASKYLGNIGFSFL